MVKRLVHERIKKLAAHFPVVSIIGPRQVGKTTLAKMIKNDLPRETIYLDLENPADQSALTNALAYFIASQDKCIIIDEVQRRPDLFPILRSVIDQHRVPARFLLLGSATPDLMHLSSETLAGRIVYVELTGFNFLEIVSSSSMTAHWLAGGFPEPFLQPEVSIRTEWFNAFIMTYIERDLPALGLNTVSQNLLRFITMVSHSHGQILNKSTFSKSLEVSVPTISNYLNYFELAFLIRLLKPYHMNLKKRLVKSPKVYLRDSGLLHHLQRIDNFDSLFKHPIIGLSWEGYVIEQIISILGNRFEYFYYRTQDGTECDLVITEKYHPLACAEVKYTSTPRMTKSLTTAIQDIKTQQNYIIAPDIPHAYPLSENVSVSSLVDFINKLR
jgi:predicted AAA+ superfamily ATPase